MKVDREKRTMYQYIWKNYLRGKKKKGHHNKQENIKEHKRLNSTTNAINSIKGVESSYHIIIFYNT